MERKINNLSICYLLFLILLFLSGSLSGTLSDLVQYFAYILPFALGLYFMRDEDPCEANYLSFDKERFKLTIPLIFPTVFLIMSLSAITSMVISFVSGAEKNVDIGRELIPALFAHALIPALFEEALFRYLPMRMLKNHSKRLVILVSAAFFALIHHSLFSIPYAFVAGVIFMAVDLVCDSVVPSFLLHFINNAVSVGMLVYKHNSVFAPTIFALVAILAVISLLFIFVKRKEYAEKFSALLKGKEQAILTLPAAVFATVCIVIAIVSII